MGAIPVVAFDADKGFQYGALANLFHFGDGSLYPKYKHSLYLEWSRFTKGSKVNQLAYDSKYLIPNVRTSAELSYCSELALDFYGFNGYQSNFYADTSSSYYRMSRNFFRAKVDFTGKLSSNHLFWEAGYHFTRLNTGVINKDKINEGKDPEDQFTGKTLYEQFLDWGIIDPKQATGGTVSHVRLGLMYDTRDFEPNPMKGVWTEAHLILAPSFLGTTHPYARFSVTHRQYFTLIPRNLSFAYRLNYQGALAGTTPFYMIPFYTVVGAGYDRDGVGGYRTVRGIMRNRIQGQDMAFFNTELRWKFWHFVAFNQNVYLGLSSFFEGGAVTRDNEPWSINPDTKAEYENYLAQGSNESLHMSAGLGFRFVMNENFILAFEYGKPFNKQDGKGGMYLNTGFLF